MLPILLLLITVYNTYTQEPIETQPIGTPKTLQTNPLNVASAIQGKPHTNEFYLATQNDSDDAFNRSKQVDIEETIKQKQVVYRQPPPTVTPSKSAPFISGDETPEARKKDADTAKGVTKTQTINIKNAPPPPTRPAPPIPANPTASSTGTLKRASKVTISTIGAAAGRKLSSAGSAAGTAAKNALIATGYHTIRGGISALNTTEKWTAAARRALQTQKQRSASIGNIQTGTLSRSNTLSRRNSAPTIRVR